MFAIIFAIIFAAISAAYGSSKGYSGGLCFIAGLFGGLIAIIIIAILPNKKEEEQEQAYAQRRASAQSREIAALKEQIRDLKEAQKSSCETDISKATDASSSNAEPPLQSEELTSTKTSVKEGRIVCNRCWQEQEETRQDCSNCGAKFI